MKKLVSLLVALTLMLALATTAFAASDVTMWIFPLGGDESERQLYDSWIEEFEAANPDINVNVELVPWDNRETKMLTAIAAGQGPDCMYLNGDIMKLFQAYGCILPITDYVSPEALTGYDEGMIENNATIKGEIYGLPCLIDVGMPAYNMDLLSKVGYDESMLPKTWAELDTLLEKLGEAGIPGIYYQYSLGPVSDYGYAQLFSEGCSVVEPDGTVTVDNEAARKVFERVSRWYQKGYSPVDSLSVFDSNASFIEGKTAVCLSPDGSGAFMRVYPKCDFKVAVGDCLAGDAGTYTMSTVACIGVSRNCKDVASTVKWIEFFTDDTHNATWNNTFGYVSPRTNAVSTNAELPYYQKMLDSKKYVRGECNHASARTLQLAYRTNLQAMAQGDLSIEEGAAKMKADIEEIVRQIAAVSNG